MTAPLLGSLSPPVCAGVAGGAACGVLNLLASRWTTRRALALDARRAVPVMVAGFLARLALLVLVIFAVPRRWMSPEAFVLVFLAAFLAGVVLEARAGARSGAGPRPPGPAHPPGVLPTGAGTDLGGAERIP
ncbi:MAG: hypothetical protein JXQ29_16205 [Planctomycetes bacterium]|nr:hypothetical protein [Planctomycetota bacterium]